MFVITETRAYIDGATVKAVKDVKGTVRFIWTGTITDEQKQFAEKRLRVVMKNFDKV